MKISLVLLIIIAFASLMQMPVSDAEESSTSTSTSSSLAERNTNSSTLIRRKRWGWLLKWFWTSVMPVVSFILTKVSVVVPILAPLATTVSVTTKAVNLGYKVASAIGSVTDLVSGMFRRSLALSDTRTTEDDVDFNLEIIDKFINQNFDDDNPLKVKIEKEHPELSEAVQFSKKGFECNQKFCKKHGNGMYGFGICSPYACECGVNGAEQRICEKHSIYDPDYETCDDPLLVKICGF